MSNLQQLLNRSASARNFVSKLLDKIDRSGDVPGMFSCKLELCPEPETISIFFGHAHVSVSKKSVRLHLKKLIINQPDIIARLYEALGRKQRDIPSEKQNTAQKLSAILRHYIDDSDPGVFRSYLEEELCLAAECRGELFQLSFKNRLLEVETLLGCLKRGFAALSSDHESLRLSHFGLLVAGDTKCCRSGTALLNRFADLLYRYDSAIRADVDMLQTTSQNERIRAIFAHSCLHLDGSASQIQVFGNLAFEKHDICFDYVKQHAQIGEPVLLSSDQLHAARFIQASKKLVSIENETSFFDYIQQADPAREMVVCTMGQAGHLIIRFLRDLSPLINELWHWGDLDRSGVLILESLRYRSALNIKPLHMDAATLKAHIGKGKKLSISEKAMIEKLLINRPQIICSELLSAIVETGLWLEQENIKL